MKEHPIIFGGPQVRAILDGRKTQTRRVIKPQPVKIGDDSWQYKNEVFGWGESLRDHLFHNEYGGKDLCPYGGVYMDGTGDRLWVRETWGCLDADHPRCPGGRKPQEGDRIVYRANPADDYQWGSGKPSQGSFCWRPSIHMPRWASRITLEVTAVRVERVQEISEADARAEGIEPRRAGQDAYGDPIKTHRTGFVYAWQEINAKRGHSWESNPWVWVVEFKRVEAS